MASGRSPLSLMGSLHGKSSSSTRSWHRHVRHIVPYRLDKLKEVTRYKTSMCYHVYCFQYTHTQCPREWPHAGPGSSVGRRSHNNRSTHYRRSWLDINVSLSSERVGIRSVLQCLLDGNVGPSAPGEKHPAMTFWVKNQWFLLQHAGLSCD